MRRLARLARPLLPALVMAMTYASVAHAHGGGDDGEPSTFPPIAISTMLGLACYLLMVWDIPGSFMGRGERSMAQTKGREPV